MNSEQPILGIDLGTSNSCIALVDSTGTPVVIRDEQGQRIIPSVVSFHPNQSVLVGAQAKARRVIDPKNTLSSVKRFIGRPYGSEEVAAARKRANYDIIKGDNDQPLVKTRVGNFAASEVSAIVLDHLARVAQSASGQAIQQVIITVPANFNDAQRQATATAGAIADLVVVRILNEPTAAALAYGHGRALNQTIAVYDFGGGTFDITILELRDNVFEVMSTAGDTFLGGDDIDDLVVEDMVMSFLQKERVDLRIDDTAMYRLRGVAEQIKVQLSKRNRAVVKMEEIAIGEGGKPLDLHYALDRAHFEDRIEQVCQRSFEICDEALRLAGISTTQIDEVILVGGTTRIPALRDKVAGYFGKPPRTDVNPDEAVAVGAALQGAAMANLLRPRRPTLQGAAASALPLRAPQEGSAAPAPDSRKPVVARSSANTVELRDEAPGGAPELPGAVDEPEDLTDLALLEEDPALPAAPPPTAGAIGRIATKKVAAMPRQAEFAEVNPFAGKDTHQVSPEPSAPAPAERTAVELPAQPPPEAPVLLDVTPRALAVATVGGFCEELIGRNSMVPVERKRVFSTAQDHQESVQLRICQGESRRFDENTEMGTLVLEDLPRRRRQDVKIQVTFEINTDGILTVTALDEQTGQAQSAHIHLVGQQSSEEVDAARDRLRQLRGE